MSVDFSELTISLANILSLTQYPQQLKAKKSFKMMYFFSETKKNKCCKRDKGVKKSQKTLIVFDLCRTQCSECRLRGQRGELGRRRCFLGPPGGQKLLALELWVSNWPSSGRTLDSVDLIPWLKAETMTMQF